MTTQPSTEFVTQWTVHARRIYAYIFTLVPNASDADDILQDTSLVLMQKFGEVGPIENFSAWACRVAYLKVLEFYRQRRSTEVVDAAFFELVSGEMTKRVDQLDYRMELLAECLAQLPRKDRHLIELRYRANHSVEYVAGQLNRTVSAVYKALARTRESLLACIRCKLREGDNP